MNQPDEVISSNLKKLREERSMSYTQLADLTGVSKSMLRQIEIGASSPTINTLWKIANGLEVPFTSLINPTYPTLSKRGFKDSDPILGTTSGYRLFPLITFDVMRNFEIYYVVIDAGVSLDADPHAGSAEEIVMVIEGILDIQVDSESVRLAANEFLRFDAGYTHSYHNQQSEMLKAFMVISYGK